jgi:small GTP-binding protein
MQGNAVCKVVLLGETGVGKTCLSHCFVQSHSSLESEATIGASFAIKDVVVQGQSLKLHIWDTAGQERYRSLAKMYYHNAQAAVLVYDITKARTFEALQGWYEELKNSASSDIGKFHVSHCRSRPQKRPDRDGGHGSGHSSPLGFRPRSSLLPHLRH